MGILVVEDTDDIREVLIELLTDEGYRAYGAQHGAEALAFLGLWTPRLILLDLMMPVMNGWQFAQAVREHPIYTSIPIVLLSAGGSLQEARRALGVPEALAKPIDYDHLVAVVQRYLGPPGSTAGSTSRTV